MTWIQRQYPRFEATLPVDLRPLGTNAPLRTQTHDISLGGLYAEMTFTQEIATVVDITLWIGDWKVSARGEVVSKHPSFGNGIKFTQLADENRERLNQFLETLQPGNRLVHGVAVPPHVKF
jgi:c-di-GMP-binding flagellar brake protein YcgR